MFVLGILVGAAVMGYRSAARAGVEAATVQQVKTIAAAEAQYFISHNRTFGTLDQLIGDKMLSRKFDGHPALIDGYVFNLTVSQKPNGFSWYQITADPQNESWVGRHFYLDSDDGRVRVNADRPAGPSDPLE